MKNKLIFTTILLTAFFFTNSSIAKETAVISIEAEIYKLESSKKLKQINTQLEQATLESSPQLITEEGKDATIEIGIENDDGKVIDMLRIYFASNATEDNYDLEFQLISEGDERLSRIEDVQLNSTITLSSAINGVAKIVKIKATKFKNHDLAVAAREANQQ